MPFRIALSGLHASSNDLQVTGNNIANATTTGFKKSRAEFVDVYALAYGALSATAPGSGVRTSNIRQLFQQGNIEYTDNATDLSITGQGFFVVADDTGRFLTRSGAFGVDRDGFVRNATGQTLQIFPSVTVGNTTTYNNGRFIDLQLQNTIGAPVSTTQVNMNVNVDAEQDPSFLFDIAIPPAPIGTDQFTDTGVSAAFDFDPTDPTTYYKSTSTTVYDSLGGPHTLTFYFRKLEDSTLPAPGLSNTWQVHTFIDSVNEITPTDDGTTTGAASGSPTVLTFNTDGTLANSWYDDGFGGVSTLGSIVYEPQNTTTGSAPVQISIDYTDITQFGSDFAINEISQDGFTTGRLTGFDVEENGIVFARYTNGNKEVLGMVGLASVPNPQGLNQEGDSLWSETFEAGDTIFGQPGTSTLGLIQAGALEASTVEIADELVQMIVAQRNYQANAQVISTADQITQTLLNIR